MLKFDFNKDYVLENEVALLRPLAEQHTEHLLYAAHQPAVWTFATIKGNTEESLREYFRLAMTGRMEEREYPFVMIDKRSNSYAGCTRFYDIKLKQHNLNLGYTWYGLQHQGTGLNKHCKYLLLDLVFQHGFERVEFTADHENKRSIAAMKSIGCTLEGLLRSNLIRQDGTRRDTAVLSILKTEWETSLKEALETKLNLNQ